MMEKIKQYKRDVDSLYYKLASLASLDSEDDYFRLWEVFIDSDEMLPSLNHIVEKWLSE